MKNKLLTVLRLVILSTAVSAENNIIEFKTGLSPASKFDVTPSKKTKFSYELGAEYRYTVTENTELGVGLAYQNHGKLKKFIDVEDSNLRVEVMDTELYDSMPLYATVKYNFRNNSDIVPYIKADLGYSFNINGNNQSRYKTYSKATGAVVDEGKLKDFKTQNGIYYSLGTGIAYKGFTAGLAYQVNTAKIEGTRYDGVKDKGSADFRRFTLSFGYQFGF
ncbi:MAG: outer membrane beta-barrel protein [Leptotrichiaceae bacterium]|nr:outer membrane beta-barrel protein [Leptotrichiaceae bacterium]